MAAGQGFKTFTTGEVLTAGDVNGYLMQGVLVFASAAARDSAITSPQEGQFAFTKDTNGLWYYDGAAWVASGATGDIEGVTAGIGISGGGTSGTVTVTNSMATAIDAKGDLVVGTGADTFSKLTVGANGTTLVADSSEATGLKWAAAASGGKVLQVVNATYSTVATTTSSTYSDTGLTATITPTSATSTILVTVHQTGLYRGAGNSQSRIGIRLLRASTTLITLENHVGYTNTDLRQMVGGTGCTYSDSPATTSATTYKTQFNNGNNAGDVYVNFDPVTSTMTLMEIGA
jgi:hypothetical protein